MQISRHWRQNANRYRLEGFTLSNGEKSLQPRIIRTKEGAPIAGGAGSGSTAAEKNSRSKPDPLAKAQIDLLAGSTSDAA